MTPESLRPILAELLGQPMPPLARQTLLAELPGWDSVAHLAMLLGLERRFAVAFKAKEMTAIATIGDLLDRLPRATP